MRREKYAKTGGTQRNRSAAPAFFRNEGDGPAMADKRALKWIGMLFGAVTLTVISTAAAVVASDVRGSTRIDYGIGDPT